jgi:carboxyl-terminal processing protease
MRRLLNHGRWVIIALVGAMALGTQIARGGDELASTNQLKSEAFVALRGGDFGVASELINKAARQAHDPATTLMARWVEQFKVQHDTFAAERQKQYQKAVDEVHLLLEHFKDSYAIDVAARAYGLADDKAAFANEPWVKNLIQTTSTLAKQYEEAHQWIKALRVYSDLASVEPSNPHWKDRLKAATRHVRLIAMYTPEEFHALREAESKERDAVDQLLKPTTSPATQPATKPADDEADAEIMTDWTETLRGVRSDMLWDALVDVREQYFREVSYKTLMEGGINGLRALITTEGLGKTFAGLKDESKKAEFLATLDELDKQARQADEGSEQLVLRNALAKLKSVNAATVNLPEEVLVSEFSDGAFGELDPFSSMIWPSDLADFTKQTQGEFSGVGIQIQTDEDGNLKVATPLEDTPAYEAGIKAGDIITHIDGRKTKGISLTQAVKLITGPENTRVRLTIKSPDGQTKDFTIRRQTIKVASIKGWKHQPGGGWSYFVDPEQKIAYVRITNFTKTTGEDFSRAVDEMRSQGARGIIMDLRYNPGGLMVAATEVCDKLLGDGLIVSTHADRETPNPPSITTARKDDDDCDLPMVVLVNQYSASASEIVSGALKDRKRALIVGERTFGKGSVQMLFPLSTRLALVKLTTSHYYLPSGRCIHREETSTDWGVNPDLTIEMTPDQMRAAIDARQELDILREANSAPAGGEHTDSQDKAPTTQDTAAGTEKVDPLACDPQLSAALLLLRLQLTGAQL